jgi:hypothetical protein
MLICSVALYVFLDLLNAITKAIFPSWAAQRSLQQGELVLLPSVHAYLEKLRWGAQHEVCVLSTTESDPVILYSEYVFVSRLWKTVLSCSLIKSVSAPGSIILNNTGTWNASSTHTHTQTHTHSMVWVRERTMPTERPPLEMLQNII